MIAVLLLHQHCDDTWTESTATLGGSAQLAFVHLAFFIQVIFAINAPNDG